MRSRSILPALLAGLLASACSRPPLPAAASQPASKPADDPRAALAEIARLRGNRLYRELSARIVPPHGPEVIRFLLAVDEFEAANARLCAWLRERAAVGLSQTIDQSYVLEDLAAYAGDSLGVFSREIELLDTLREDGAAEVAYCVPARLAPRRARLRLARDTWLLDAGDAVPETLPAAFRALAEGLDQVVLELELGRIPAAELTAGPELLVDKVKARLRRCVGLLGKARTERGG